MRDSVAFGSAPRSRSSRTKSSSPPCTAASSAVSPLQRAASTSAPASRSRRARARLPLAQAKSSGVSPFSSTGSGSAPASSRAAAMAVSPRNAAHESGVEPSARAALTSAPSASSACTASRSRRCTASNRLGAGSGTCATAGPGAANARRIASTPPMCLRKVAMTLMRLPEKGHESGRVLGATRPCNRSLCYERLNGNAKAHAPGARRRGCRHRPDGKLPVSCLARTPVRRTAEPSRASSARLP